jgi:hypothetical protein
LLCVCGVGRGRGRLYLCEKGGARQISASVYSCLRYRADKVGGGFGREGRGVAAVLSIQI